MDTSVSQTLTRRLLKTGFFKLHLCDLAPPTRPSRQPLPFCGPAPLSGRLSWVGLARLLLFPLPPAAGLHSVQRAPGRLAFAAGRERTGKRGQELDWEPGKPRESGVPMGLGKGRGAQGLA